MGASARISILSLCCFVGFQFYQLVNIVVLTSRHCWPVSDFWLENSLPLTPYEFFSAFFCLAFIWALAEVYALVQDRSQLAVRSCLLGIIFTFLLMCGFMQLALWQSIEVMDGKRSLADYWAKTYHWPDWMGTDIHAKEADIHWMQREWIKDQEMKKSDPDDPYQSWWGFVWERTCMVGIEVSQVNSQTWDAWGKEHERLIEKYYKDLELILVRENLFRAHGVPPEYDTSGWPKYAPKLIQK